MMATYSGDIIVMVIIMIMRLLMMPRLMVATYSGDKFEGLSTVVPRALDQSAVVQEQSVVSYNLKHTKHFKTIKHLNLF